MQQGRATGLVLDFDDVDDANVESIEFIFKQYDSVSAPVLKSSNFPGDASWNEEAQGYLVPWTVEETYRFLAKHSFYGEARIHMKDTSDMPESKPFELYMEPTMYQKGT